MGKQAVCAWVSTQADAEKIVLACIATGIDPKEISLSPAQNSGMSAVSALPSLSSRNWRTENRMPAISAALTADMPKLEKQTHAAEGATIGAATGCVIGGICGLLVGLGTLVIPSMGSLFAAGPLMAALSGIGAGGCIGGILGALIGAGIPEKQAQDDKRKMIEGNILMTIYALNEQQAKHIVEIMQQNRAQNISETTTHAAALYK